MPRDLTSTMLTELAKNLIRPAFFVEMETAATGSPPVAQYVRVWSGTGTISWNGQSWIGVGKFGGLSPLGETTEVRAEGIKLSLSGIPSDLVTVAMTEALPGKPVQVWFGALDGAGAVLADPAEAWSGKTDAVNIQEGGETSTIEIAVEGELVRMRRPQAHRYTHEDQQIEFTGDRGFEYMEQLQELNLVLGRAGPPPFGPEYQPPPPPEPENDWD